MSDIDIQNWKKQFIEKCKYREFYPNYRTSRFTVIMEEIQELENIVSQLLEEKDKQFHQRLLLIQHAASASHLLRALRRAIVEYSPQEGSNN